jgi:hypothetical protein
MVFFYRNGKGILKCIWNHKTPGKGKAFWRKMSKLVCWLTRWQLSNTPQHLSPPTHQTKCYSQKATSRRAKEISTAGTEICLHQHLTNTGRCQRCRTSRVQRPPGDSMLSSATTRIPEPDWVALFWGPYQLSRNPLWAKRKNANNYLSPATIPWCPLEISEKT